MQDPIKKQLPLTEGVFHILLSLSDGPRHGYGIMQEVKERTNGRVHLGPGTLYGAIKRLIKRELIEEIERAPETPTEEARRYYRLTHLGGLVLRAESVRLEEMVRHARQKRQLPELPEQIGGTA
ncbi:MAG: helix-turn-helix transcriptional regulator [Anaerolineae bacterium]|jgi:DNA-binding PadR family transcriptional regulator|nr:helix-turn-helix transcriptional regulator [Anaerolineae bacterium]